MSDCILWQLEFLQQRGNFSEQNYQKREVIDLHSTLLTINMFFEHGIYSVQQNLSSCWVVFLTRPPMFFEKISLINGI